MPVHLVLRRLLGDAASVEDAWDLLRETPVLGLQLHHRRRRARRRRRASSSRPQGVARIEPRDGLLAHTNHFLDEALARDEGDQPGEWLAGSRARLAAAVRRCAAGAGRRARAARDAREPIRRRSAVTTSRPGEPGRPLVDTVVSLAMRPGVPELRVAAGRPCEFAFLRYDI